MYYNDDAFQKVFWWEEGGRIHYYVRQLSVLVVHLTGVSKTRYFLIWKKGIKKCAARDEILYSTQVFLSLSLSHNN